MSTKQFIIILFSIAFLWFHCGKKEAGTTYEKSVVQSEKELVKVDIPETDWKKSLMIEPIVIQTENKEAQSIANMLSERISSTLSKTKNLKIISASTKKTKANYNLKNEIEENNGIIKVTFKMTDTQTGSTVWAETYEEELESMMIVEEMASSAVEVIGFEPVQSSKYRISKSIMDNYIKARSHLEMENLKDLDHAIDSFKEILREDSTYVLAYTGLAESYLKIVNLEKSRNPVWLRLAQESSLKAVQIDPNLAEGYLNLGQVDLLRGDFKQAELRFRKALDINPNLYKAWRGLANVLIHYGLYESCLKIYEKMQDLNPADADVTLSKAMILTGLGKYEQAESEILKAIQNHPDALYFYSFLALNKYYQGNNQTAIQEIEKGLQSNTYQPFSHAVLGMIHARQQKFDEALGEIELEVKPYAGNDASLATAVAAVYSLLGQKGQAIQWLKKAYDWGYREYPWLVGDPNFENMKSDERYIHLLEKIRKGWEEKMLTYNIPVEI